MMRQKLLEYRKAWRKIAIMGAAASKKAEGTILQSIYRLWHGESVPEENKNIIEKALAKYATARELEAEAIAMNMVEWAGGVCGLCGGSVAATGDNRLLGQCECSFWHYNPIVDKWVRGAKFDTVTL